MLLRKRLLLFVGHFLKFPRVNQVIGQEVLKVSIQIDITNRIENFESNKSDVKNDFIVNYCD